VASKRARDAESRPAALPWVKRCYKFPPAMIGRIERVVREIGITESEFVRRVVDEHLRANYPAAAAAAAEGVKR
jgi:hypothetical protein